MKNRAIGIIGASMLIFMILVAIFAPFLAPHSPHVQSGASFEKPSVEHVLGTNDIGQDIFSELIYGTRNSLLVGGISAAIATVIGVVVGVLSGWYGGAIDRVLMKITTFFMTIPFLPTVIILAAFTKSGIWSMSLILGVMSWTGIARILRSVTMKLRESTYIKISKSMGAGDLYIFRTYILREIAPLVLYRVVIRVKSGILAESSMSFLGLGSSVAKSWGSIIFYAQTKNALLTGAWVWWIIPPGLCICLVSMGLMMVSYSLEKESDKRIGAGV